MKLTIFLTLSCLSAALAGLVKPNQGTPKSQDVESVLEVLSFDALADALAEDIAGMIGNNSTEAAISKIQQAMSGDRQAFKAHHISITKFMMQLGYLVTSTPSEEPLAAVVDEVEGKPEGIARNVETRQPKGSNDLEKISSVLGGIGGKTDLKRIIDRISTIVREKEGIATSRSLGPKLGNYVAELLPLTSLVNKLGLGPLSIVTLLVDALLLALLGLGPIVGKLLLNLGLIGERN